MSEEMLLIETDPPLTANEGALIGTGGVPNLPSVLPAIISEAELNFTLAGQELKVAEQADTPIDAKNTISGDPTMGEVGFQRYGDAAFTDGSNTVDGRREEFLADSSRDTIFAGQGSEMRDAGTLLDSASHADAVNLVFEQANQQ